MRVLAVIFCLFLSMQLFAQSADTIHKQDTSVNGKIRCLATLPESTRPLIIIDGRVLPSDSLKNINLTNIVRIDTLKRILGKDVYPERPDNGAIILSTKQGAIKSYQKKFGAFSKEYKAYFEDPKLNKNVLYVLNGAPVNDFSIDGIRTLYDIPSKKIRKVTFLRVANSSFDNPAPVIVIKTKK